MKEDARRNPFQVEDDVEGWPLNYPCEECGAETGEECRPFCTAPPAAQLVDEEAPGSHSTVPPMTLRERVGGTASTRRPVTTPDAPHQHRDREEAATDSLAAVLGTLTELAAAARADDVERYRAAQRVAQRQDLSDEQVRDAYQWGRREQGQADFDWQGK